MNTRKTDHPTNTTPPNVMEIPTSLDRVWIFKYIVYISYWDEGQEIKKGQYGFCIGKNYTDAVAFIENYYGEELVAISCLEPINAVTPIARSYDDWTEIAESLSWDSKKLEPYIA